LRMDATFSLRQRVPEILHWHICKTCGRVIVWRLKLRYRPLSKAEFSRASWQRAQSTILLQWIRISARRPRRHPFLSTRPGLNIIRHAISLQAGRVQEVFADNSRFLLTTTIRFKRLQRSIWLHSRRMAGYLTVLS